MDEYICRNDVFTAEQKAKIKYLPKKNEIYTLIEIVPTPLTGRTEGYIFEELPNPNLTDGTPVSFRPSRFVPVNKNITIESLTKETELYGV